MSLANGVGTEGLAKVTVELVEVMPSEGVDGLCVHFRCDPLCHHLVGLDGALAAPDPPAVVDAGRQHFTEGPNPILSLDLSRVDLTDEVLQFGGGLASPTLVPMGDHDHPAPLP